MRIYIDGVGKIVDSTIELEGLTVISGENDTGKSTVGKVFYSVIQALNAFQFVVASQNRERLQKLFSNLYYDIRREVDVSENSDIKNFFAAVRGGILSRDDIPQSIIVSLAKDVLSNIEINSDLRERINRQIADIESSDGSAAKDDEVIRKSIDRLLKSEFSGNIVCNFPTRSGRDARVEISDGATSVLSFAIDENRVKDLKSSGPLGIRDSTLIEGPSIINYYPALSEFDTLGVKRMRGGAIPYHVVDLSKKLQGVKREFDLLSKATIRNFPEALKGNLEYDDKTLGFVFNDGRCSIPSSNVASGIKSLAIMDLLILGEYVTDGSLIVLDEPETNLHPKWQILYAKTICTLAEAGAKILVTTHSPYMLEALKGYSTELSSPRFYMSKDSEKGAKLVDVHGDITPIIDVLSKPLLDLINELGE